MQNNLCVFFSVLFDISKIRIKSSKKIASATNFFQTKVDGRPCWDEEIMQSDFSVAVLLFGALIAEKQTGRFSSGSELATAMNATSKNHVVS